MNYFLIILYLMAISSKPVNAQLIIRGCLCVFCLSFVNQFKEASGVERRREKKNDADDFYLTKDEYFQQKLPLQLYFLICHSVLFN